MNIKKLKNTKIIYLAVLLAAGVLLAVLSGTGTQNKQTTDETQVMDFVPDCAGQEQRLGQLLETIDGISDVSVFITYENTGRRSIAFVSESESVSGSDKKSNTTKTEPVIQKNGSDENPFVSEEILPEIRGIIIAAKGAGDKYVNALITDAVSSAMGVSVHRVKVLAK